MDRVSTAGFVLFLSLYPTVGAVRECCGDLSHVEPFSLPPVQHSAILSEPLKAYSIFPSKIEVSGSDPKLSA